ncbi:MAG: guanylate kinase [Candidatus Hydrogenedentes bacterium]|nr:guanylate kinase [Candidatus Hydrogenedentota bacterium]
MARHGIVFVLSGPSAAGKHTILEKALKLDTNIELSISTTTREPRENEVHGVDYYFVEKKAFHERVAAGDFVEHAKVHGNFYGIQRSELNRRLHSGRDVAIQMDVQGMGTLAKTDLDLVTIFVVPPSLDELGRRLVHRGANTDDEIAVRLQNACDEMKARHAYDYIIVNDKLEDAVRDFLAILHAERCLATRQP